MRSYLGALWQSRSRWRVNSNSNIAETQQVRVYATASRPCPLCTKQIVRITMNHKTSHRTRGLRVALGEQLVFQAQDTRRSGSGAGRTTAVKFCRAARISFLRWAIGQLLTGALTSPASPKSKASRSRPTHIRIGGLTTWSEVVATPLPRCFDALKSAAREIGGIQIQNRGTVAGNLCNASPAADGVPPLLALDAEVELVSGRGNAPCAALADFIVGNRKTLRRPDEILTNVIVPRTLDDAAPLF